MMKNEIKYSLMMLMELLVWCFFFGLSVRAYGSNEGYTLFLVTVMFTFMIGRHFTMWMDIMKELKTKKVELG